MVYFKDGKKKVKNIIASLHEFGLMTRGRWEMLVANEEKEFKAGETKIIDIVPIKLEHEEICLSCPLQRHGLGVVVAVGARGKPKLVEEERRIDYAVFTAVEDGKVSKNELLGVVNIFPTLIRIVKTLPSTY